MNSTVFISASSGVYIFSFSPQVLNKEEFHLIVEVMF